MSIKSKPLTAKLFVLVLLMVTVISAVLTWRSSQGINGLSNQLTDITEASLKQALTDRLQAEVFGYGEQMKGYLNTAYRIALSMADVTASNIDADNAFSREDLGILFGQMLRANTDVNSSYAHFEANGYDGKDAEYVGGNHFFSSGSRGNLDIYWMRHQGSVISPIKVDAEEKYDSTLDEFGMRVAEWYLCPRDTRQACLMEPYLDEVQGKMEMMTSITLPIMKDRQFRGVAGVDINMPKFQERVSLLSQELYNGQGRVTLISQRGLITVSSHYQISQARPFNEVQPELAAKLKSLSAGNNIWFTDTNLYVAREIRLDDINATWTLLVEVPLSAALADINQLIGVSHEQKQKVMNTQILLAVIFSVFALALIAILLRSITRPIEQLSAQVKQLASADGDLSQSLSMDTHAELIELGGNFNQFLYKLREMVLSIKNVREQLRKESENNYSISQDTEKATQKQQSEIDSVVTATEEMSATAGEVARIAATVSEQTSDINQTLIVSQKQLAETVNTVSELNGSMAIANESIMQVSLRSDEINRILTVIQGVAEQTNLLALNAAIEAARAGTHGRGFAVVADEVRSLSLRTQESTTEINSMISSLQEEVQKAVVIIETGSAQAGEAINTTRQAHESLQNVVEGVGEINDNIRQVATAAEEQSSVSDEITRSLSALGNEAQELSLLAIEENASSGRIAAQLDVLDEQLAALQTE